MYEPLSLYIFHPNKQINIRILIMKFRPLKLTLLTYVFHLLYNYCGATDSYLEIDSILNRGYSFLRDHSQFIERPVTTLSKYHIFDLKLNVDQMISADQGSSDVIFEKRKEDTKDIQEQKLLREYTPKELHEALDFVIKGNYKVTNTNFLYQRARSIPKLYKKETVLAFYDRPELTLHNHGKDGKTPKLSPIFVKDAIKIFNKDEITDFTNQKEYVETALLFLEKYGTHYLKKATFGSRKAMITEVKRDREAPTGTSVSYITPGSMSLISEKDKEGVRYKGFDHFVEVGNCKTPQTSSLSFSDCDAKTSTLSLISMEVEYLYELFNPSSSKPDIKLDDGKELPSLDNVYKNLKNFETAIETAMNIRSTVISDLEVMNNLDNDKTTGIACLADSQHYTFSKFSSSLFGENFKVDCDKPIFKLKKNNQISYSDPTSAAGHKNKKESTYMCNTKIFNLTPEDLLNNQLFNRRFIKGLSFKSNKPVIGSEGDTEICTNFWVHKGNPNKKNNKENSKSNNNGKASSESIEYLCLQTTSNFLDPKLIVDVKFKNFGTEACKKAIDFATRSYACECDHNIGKWFSDKETNNIHLCYAKKDNLLK